MLLVPLEELKVLGKPSKAFGQDKTKRIVDLDLLFFCLLVCLPLAPEKLDLVPMDTRAGVLLNMLNK